MHGTDRFSELNPAVNAFFFLSVIVFTVVSFHPAVLIISFISSLSYLFILRGRKALSFFLRFSFPMMLLTLFINPAFNHRGTVILLYLPSGNPLTLESILFGVAASLMTASAIMWFACLTDVMTTDKFIYLFGRIVPSLSLLLSMTVRYIPLFANRYRTVYEARKTLSPQNKGRIRNAFTVFSSVVTWSLEASVNTADSMHSRGYGLKGRTSFAIYLFADRDIMFMVFYSLSAIFLIGIFASSEIYWQYYPYVSGVLFTPVSVACFAVFAIICMSPVLYDIKEERNWKSSISAV